MPGIAVATFAKAVAAPAYFHVSVANRRSGARMLVGKDGTRYLYQSLLHPRRANILLRAYFSGNLGCQWMLGSRAKRDLVLCLRKDAHPSPTTETSRTLRAYLDLPHNIPYLKFTTKPECWWRTLSCVPDLMALQISDTVFYFVPLMERHEQFEFLSYDVPGAIRRLLSWFLMVYCFTIYVGVVHNRKWPHYFWHHMMMGLLLENCIQITWYSGNFLPLIHYNGTFGLLLLECMRCALAGKYVNLPFISDAAYIHTPFVRGDD